GFSPFLVACRASSRCSRPWTQLRWSPPSSPAALPGGFCFPRSSAEYGIASLSAESTRSIGSQASCFSDSAPFSSASWCCSSPDCCDAKICPEQRLLRRAVDRELALPHALIETPRHIGNRLLAKS